MNVAQMPSFSEVASGITLLTALAFVISLICDMGFLAACGIAYFNVPTTLADHTQSAILWIPISGAGVLIGSLLARPAASHAMRAESEGRKPHVGARVFVVLLAAGISVFGFM